MNITLKKKLSTAIGSVVVIVAVQYLGMSEAAAVTVSQMVAGITSAYMVGQGMADWGKEKSQIVEVTG